MIAQLAAIPAHEAIRIGAWAALAIGGLAIFVLAIVGGGGRCD